LRKRPAKPRAIFRAVALLLALFLLCGLSGCTTLDAFLDSISPAPENSRAVKIGVLEPLSGVDEKAAQAEIRGIELAHKLYPTVLGREVELVYADNQSDIDIAKRRAEELRDLGVSLVLGSYDNLLFLAEKYVFEDAQIPAISITGTNPLLTVGSQYSVRACYVDTFQGIAAAKYFYEDLGVDSVAIWKQRDDDYGSAMAQSFAEKLRSISGNEDAISMTMEFGADQEDFEPQLSLLQTAGVQNIYMPCSAEKAAKLISLCREHGLRYFFVGTQRWGDEDILQYGGDLEGVTFTSVFDEEAELTERAQVFREAYAAAYGEEDIPEAAALGYDAYLLALSAIETAGRADDRQLIMETLYSMRGFAGVTGDIDLDANGDPIRSFIIKRIRDGAYVYEDKAEPNWGDGENAPLNNVAPLEENLIDAAIEQLKTQSEAPDGAGGETPAAGTAAE
jgi:branched-chain amino acid transport system substrate-binding protein